MDATSTNVEAITVPGRWDFEYEYFAGAAASRFFAELREGRIMGTLCPSCERVLVPAREYCDACFEPTTEWCATGTVGTVEAFTILATQFPGMPAPPRAIVYVTLEGADTAILNYLDGVDLSDVDAAAEMLLQQPVVEVVFTDQPEGRITDFSFRIRPTT